MPEPTNLADYVRDRSVAIALGKALFWDMQVGSDGVQACATCHFRAGADTRKKNQVSPGLLRVVFQPNSAGQIVAVPNADLTFNGQGPNDTLSPADFPFRRLADPTNRESAIVADSNNVVSSQGVHHAIYDTAGRPAPDPENFRVGNANVRRVEPRNTPTMINAVFNHRNFWDMRAQDVFNGVNPFGERDAEAFVYAVDRPGNLVKTKVRLENSSLASQAVGPPTNRFEMSADGRPFPMVGRELTLEIGRRNRTLARRLRGVVPLAGQLVRPDDSVLGPLSRAPRRGLSVDYEAMIRAAFLPRWWASTKLIRVAEEGTTTVVNLRGDTGLRRHALRPFPEGPGGRTAAGRRGARSPDLLQHSAGATRQLRLLPLRLAAHRGVGRLDCDPRPDPHRRRPAERHRHPQHRCPGDDRGPRQRRPRSVRGVALGCGP